MEDYTINVKGPKVCSQCGSWYDLQVHHKNGNHNDNRPENLEWRCREICHARDAHHHHIPKGRKSETPQSQRFEKENDDLTFEFKPNWRNI